uniref:Uncharacterized protein n=1 Tax=Salix viminalis TaxID=40686 RepID=A0A6N2NKM7_SALVM
MFLEVLGSWRALTKWEEIRGERDEFEMDVHIEDFASDIISKTAFGSNYEEGKRVFSLQDKQKHLVFDAIGNVSIPGFRKPLGCIMEFQQASWFGTKPTLAISDPDMIKEVLMNTGDGSFQRYGKTIL